MKHLYFNVINGEVVEPTALPAYRATLDWKMKVVSLDVCFSKDNMERNGEDWVQGQLEKVKQEWKDYAWLNKGLKKFKWKMCGKRQVYYVPDWFIYLNAWSGGSYE